MSNTLTDTRAALRTLLTGAGLQVVSYLPERPTPPLVIVTTGQPYVQRAERYGQHTITLTTLLLTAKATNEVMTEQLDEMIATLAITVWNSDGFDLGPVDSPSQFTVGTANYLGTTVDVTAVDVLEVS